ncbi:MAG: hypothetical protein JEZ04_00560 [Spirochaetales bacterium]|nr:hypothetical protein [Spirochaetales bacterium]
MRKLVLGIYLILLTTLLFASGANRITVLEFTTSGVSEAEMLIFIDYIASEITQNSNYTLIDRRQRVKILEELSFSNSGCTDEECQLEIGKLLSANNIIVGSIGSIGSTYILNMQLVDIETGETTETISNKYKNLDELVNDSKSLMTILLRSDEQAEAHEAAVEQPSTTTSAVSAADVPHQISSRPGLFGSPIYIYKKRPYYSSESTDLAKIIMLNIPNTTENKTIYNNYLNERDTSFGFVWGGLGALGLGYIGGAIAGGMLDSEFGFDNVMNIAAISGFGLFVVMEIIGLIMTSSSHAKLGEMVKIYNSNLYK